MSEALKTWKRKLSYLQRQEAIAADSAQKFALREQIDEAKTKITELEATPSDSSSASGAFHGDTSRILKYAPEKLIGRDDELKLLNVPKTPSNWKAVMVIIGLLVVAAVVVAFRDYWLPLLPKSLYRTHAPIHSDFNWPEHMTSTQVENGRWYEYGGSGEKPYDRKAGLAYISQRDLNRDADIADHFNKPAFMGQGLGQRLNPATCYVAIGESLKRKKIGNWALVRKEQSPKTVKALITDTHGMGDTRDLAVSTGVIKELGLVLTQDSLLIGFPSDDEAAKLPKATSSTNRGL